MSIRFLSHLLVLFLSVASVPAGAAGLEDADERLFQVQLALATKGDARAQYFLGEMYLNGLGTKQNTGEAFKWYAKAAEKGDPLAKRKLTYRAKIEEDLRQEKALEKTEKTPEPTPSLEKPKKFDSASKKTGKAKKPDSVVAQKKENSVDEEKAIDDERIRTAEKAKRRAAVRAMILDRIRHPVGDPFE